MFGEFSLEYGVITFVVTCCILGLLCLFDTCDAQRMFSRRDK